MVLDKACPVPATAQPHWEVGIFISGSRTLQSNLALSAAPSAPYCTSPVRRHRSRKSQFLVLIQCIQWRQNSLRSCTADEVADLRHEQRVGPFDYISFFEAIPLTLLMYYPVGSAPSTWSLNGDHALLFTFGLVPASQLSKHLQTYLPNTLVPLLRRLSRGSRLQFSIRYAPQQSYSILILCTHLVTVGKTNTLNVKALAPATSDQRHLTPNLRHVEGVMPSLYHVVRTPSCIHPLQTRD